MERNLEVMNHSTDSRLSTDQSDIYIPPSEQRRFAASYTAGYMPRVPERNDWLTQRRRHTNALELDQPPQVASGASLDGGFCTDDWYRVKCRIEVENWTQHALTDPVVTIRGGELAMLPRSIQPYKREVMMTRCSYRIFGGSCGVVSWLIEPLQRRLVVMWSVPFSLVFFRNKLAVALTPIASKEDCASVDNWFDKMYHGDVGDIFSDFGSKEYSRTIQAIYVRDEGARLNIESNMTDGYNAHVRIVFKST